MPNQQVLSYLTSNLTKEQQREDERLRKITDYIGSILTEEQQREEEMLGKITAEQEKKLSSFLLARN